MIIAMILMALSGVCGALATITGTGVLVVIAPFLFYATMRYFCGSFRISYIMATTSSCVGILNIPTALK